MIKIVVEITTISNDSNS